MANEFSINLNFQYSNGNASRKITPGAITLPQATQGVESAIVTVNTSAEETISFPNLTTPSFLVMRSMEATTTGNYVTLGPNSTAAGGMVPLVRIGPKDIQVLRLTSTGPTIKAQANTAAVNVEFTAFEL